MTTEAQLRQAALALPDVVESDGAFRVHDAAFVAEVPGVGIELRLDDDDAARLIAEVPAAEEAPGGVRISLDDLDDQRLDHWVRRAWLACAPEDLVDEVLVADHDGPDRPRER